MAEEKTTIIEPITAQPVDTEAITSWAVRVQAEVVVSVLIVCADEPGLAVLQDEPDLLPV